MSSQTSKIPISRKNFDALIFDLDGVVTQTAKVHARAWKQLFDEYLGNRSEREKTGYEPFDIDMDYGKYVDGKPRYQGVKSFLDSRNIHIPYGTPDDPPDNETICGLGNRKNLLFHELLKRNGVMVYEQATRLIRSARAKGMKTAVVSSSKNCAAVLETAHIKSLFDEKVDGIDSELIGLNGKPDPDIFLEAAHSLGVSPARSVAFEDAEAGVESAARAGFGLVIGVDRVGHAHALINKGAHAVVTDLSQVSIDDGKGTINSPPSALSSLEDIRDAVTGRRAAVFLDYDGTLTPIVDDPEKALIHDHMRSVLINLSKHCHVSVISGRDLNDVRGKVGINDITYAGSHGFEISGPEEANIEFQRGQEFLPLLDEAEEYLSKKTANVPGAVVERKKFSVALHYRKVKGDRVKDLEDIFDRFIEGRPRLRKSSGKKVLEAQPRIDWHKGKALQWLLEKMDLAGSDVAVFYIGDDTTDEDAFKALPESGIGIVVMEEPRRTAAGYSLKDPSEVEKFLSHLPALFKMSG